jgi:hypothetical protein
MSSGVSSRAGHEGAGRRRVPAVLRDLLAGTWRLVRGPLGGPSLPALVRWWRAHDARLTAGGPPARQRSRRRAVLLIVAGLLGTQVLIGTPALAYDCSDPPNPERPGAGMVGALDPAPIGVGQPGSVYDEVGYAGLVWHVYDDNCVLSKGVTDPNATIDTWAGNELFNVGKNIVGATNSLHYALLGGDLVKPLDDLVMTGTVALYNSVYAPWFGLFALLLAVVVFRHIWKGDLATISKRGMWALAGMWLAAATYLTPLLYTHVLDEILITGTSQVQAGFLKQVGVDERNALPTVLHDNVIYRSWLRGEFGSPDAPQAQQYGRDLVRAQAWTKQEVASGADAGSPEPKKAQYKAIATQLGSSSGYFKGTDGSRTGAGFLAMFQGLAYGLFQLLAKAGILLAQVLLRVLILAGPIIGLVALLYHDVLRSVGRAAGAALLNVVVIAALAGMHTLMLTWLFNPARGLPLLTQMLLATLVTVVFFLVGKPVRRMWQMVELSVGTVGGAVPSAPGLFSRFRRGATAPTAQDQFWDHVRSTDPDAADEVVVPQRSRQRYRPEASNPVAAAALRLDHRAPAAGELPAASGSGSDGAPALPASGPPRGYGGPVAALPSASASRLVDTAPVTDRAAWERHQDDAPVVPSEISTPEYDNRAVPGPRRADLEVVAGKPVFVLYRPSRGLEVADNSGNQG